MRRILLAGLIVVVAFAASPVFAQLCPPGSFGPTGGEEPCFPCPVGSYSDIEGAQSCSVCPMGTFQNTTGAIACETCPDGYIAPTIASAECTPCGPGFTSNATHTECIEETVAVVGMTWGVVKVWYR